MGTTTDLARAAGGALGYDDVTISNYITILRRRGHISEQGRGTWAADMTVSDACAVLIAVLGGFAARDAAETFKAISNLPFRRLRAHTGRLRAHESSEVRRAYGRDVDRWGREKFRGEPPNGIFERTKSTDVLGTAIKDLLTQATAYASLANEGIGSTLDPLNPFRFPEPWSATLRIVLPGPTREAVADAAKAGILPGAIIGTRVTEGRAVSARYGDQLELSAFPDTDERGTAEPPSDCVVTRIIGRRGFIAIAKMLIAPTARSRIRAPKER